MKILVIGTGEYVVGLIDATLASDKSSHGVILPVLFDLRSQAPDSIESILLAGTRGTQMPRIRQHLAQALGTRYKNLNVTLEATFPEDHIVSDPFACKSKHKHFLLLFLTHPFLVVVVVVVVVT